MANLISLSLASVMSAKMGKVSVRDFGAKGIWKDDTAAIQSAIDDMARKGGGDVVIPPGNYNISATIDIKSNVHLECMNGVTIRPTVDIHMIRLRKNAQISGCRLETYGLSDFTNSCIYLDGTDLFNFDHNTVIRNVVIYGSFNRVKTPAEKGGTGIFFYAKGIAGDTSFWSNVCGVRVYDVSIIYMGKAIYMRADNAGNGTTQFVNGNQFSMISFSGNQYDIYMEGALDRDQVHNGVYHVSGNTFMDLQSQTFKDITKKIYFISGIYNRILAKVWDIYYLDESGVVAEFTELSRGNIITSNLEKKNVEDKGIQNRVDGVYESNNTFTGTFDGVMASGTLLPSVSDVHLLAGNQDDFFAFANKRFTVKQTQGPGIDSGSLANVFDLVPNTTARWDVSTNTTPIVIEILFPETISYLGSFGITFGIYDESPKSVKLEKLLNGNWTEEFILVNQPSRRYVTKDHISYRADGLRITMSGTNAASGKLRVYRIFANASDAAGAAFLQTIGGKLYGNLDMGNGYLTIGNTASFASLPTPSDEHRGKMITVRGSAGAQDNVYMCVKTSSDTYVWMKINLTTI